MRLVLLTLSIVITVLCFLSEHGRAMMQTIRAIQSATTWSFMVVLLPV